MNTEMEKIERLLEKPCSIIDFLPERVMPGTGGQFFDVEEYVLHNGGSFNLRGRFANVLLKLMCYYHIEIQWGGRTQDRPAPETLDRAVGEIMESHSGTLNVLLPEEDALVVLDGDSLNLSVYHASETMGTLMEKITFSEGLFWRKSEY